jgi:transposase
MNRFTAASARSVRVDRRWSGMAKKYLVSLTEEERAALGRKLSAGRASARELVRTRILLKADCGPRGPAWSDAAIAAALDVGVSTVERVRKRCAESGLEVALRHRRPRREYRRKLDGEQEAHLIALACSPPPVGRRLWTLRLLADRMIELRFVDGLSYETVRRMLKKNVLKPWLTERWCIPPQASGEFVWRMEDVLEVYTRPYDPKRPQVCLDEVSKQLLADARPARQPGRGRAKRLDYEYERRGTTNLFLCCEPLHGWRSVRVTERRTRRDWANVIKELVEVHYPEAEKIVLVMDNLNTHTPGSLYEAFPPAEAKWLANKLESHYTPNHGSWLNIAEIELSVLSRQCLDGRIPDRETLEREVAAWEAERNGLGGTVDWRFTTEDARIKLKRLYPSVEG